MDSDRKDNLINMLLTYKEGMGVIEDLLDKLRSLDRCSGREIFKIIWEILETAGSVKLDGGCTISLKGDELEFAEIGSGKPIDFIDDEYRDEEKFKTREWFTGLYKEIVNEKGVLNWNSKDDDEKITRIKRRFKDPAGMNIALAGLEENTDIFMFYRRNGKNPFLSHEIQVLRILVGVVSFFMYREYKEKEKSQAYYYSTLAHKFEKCFNTPVTNLSYLLRQFIHPYNDRARLLTFAIQDFIDLWANHFSVITYHGDETHGKGWIEGFELGKFKEDLGYFATHLFNLRANDLYDHCNETGEKLPAGSKSLEALWNGEISRKDFFILKVFNDEENTWIFGIHPFFRVMLINMLKNAIEALDLFEISRGLPDPKPKPEISLSASQDDENTVIIFKNQGRPIEDEILERLRLLFKVAREGNFHFLTGAFEMAVKENQYSNKPGIGTGMSLAEAAQYLSRIVRIKDGKEMDRGWMEVEKNQTQPFPETQFTIHFPFGSKLIELYRMDIYGFQKNKDRVSFKWSKT